MKKNLREKSLKFFGHSIKHDGKTISNNQSVEPGHRSSCLVHKDSGGKDFGRKDFDCSRIGYRTAVGGSSNSSLFSQLGKSSGTAKSKDCRRNSTLADNYGSHSNRHTDQSCGN